MLWELRNHRVIHPGDVFIASPGRISSTGPPRVKLIIAQVQLGVQAAVSTFSRSLVVLQ